MRGEIACFTSGLNGYSSTAGPTFDRGVTRGRHSADWSASGPASPGGVQVLRSRSHGLAAAHRVPSPGTEVSARDAKVSAVSRPGMDTEKPETRVTRVRLPDLKLSL